MSKVIIYKDKIVAIYRGTRKGKHNFREIQTNDFFKGKVREFLKKPSISHIGDILNASNIEIPSDLRNEMHDKAFFLMYLCWAFENNQKPIVVDEDVRLALKAECMKIRTETAYEKICPSCNNRTLWTSVGKISPYFRAYCIKCKKVIMEWNPLNRQ